MEEAGVILFLVDAQTGITDLDLEIVQMVRQEWKPVMLIVNKIDTGVQEYLTAEFYGLGHGRYCCMESVPTTDTAQVTCWMS